MTPGQIAAAAAAAALAGLVAWRRRRLGLERTALALAAAVALGVYASGILSDLPNAEHVITDVAQALGRWTYLLVGGLAFLETGAFVGLVAPGEFTVILGGVIAGQGEINFTILLGIVWVSAVLGDSTSFFIGRRLGRAFLIKHGARIRITPDRLGQVEEYFGRYGGRTIVIGRFIGLVRALAPFIAGTSGLRYGTFVPYSIVGTGLWAATFCTLGYVFYRSFTEVADVAGRATVAFGFLVGLIVLAVYCYRRLRKPDERRRLKAWLERQGERPLLRPVAAVSRAAWRWALRPLWTVIGPPLRFVRDRLRPGGLALEFTTAGAVAAVGLYVFGLYVSVLADDPGLTPLDQEARDLVERLRADLAVDVAKVITELGSLPVALLVVLGTAAALAARGRGAGVVALVVGFALIYVTVRITKVEIGRTRPPNNLIDVSGAGFPSAHAAYSTVYVAVALLVARALGGLVSGAALLLAGVALAGVVGLSRIYLGAHYWSDVAGGWALGLGIFGVCAAVTLIVTHLRQNGSSPGPLP